MPVRIDVIDQKYPYSQKSGDFERGYLEDVDILTDKLPPTDESNRFIDEMRKIKRVGPASADSRYASKTSKVVMRGMQIAIFDTYILISPWADPYMPTSFNSKAADQYNQDTTKQPYKLRNVQFKSGIEFAGSSDETGARYRARIIPLLPSGKPY